MRITRLYLRNYRVFEDELDLEMPAGVVGIYGVNGAGKSALLESIRWTMFGKARTPNDQVRTSGVNADCITEVEFEHEGHLYLVRRTITGANSTVRAEAHWNGQQVAEGVRDVASYVHSVIGMDDAAFRASVFAEQKQVAAFSSLNPQKRRDLVMRLLGITPLDKARDSARAEARAARGDHDRLAARLPDLAALEETLAAARHAHATATDEASAAEAARAASAEVVALADAELERVADLARTYELLVAQGKAAAETLTEAAARLEALRVEQVGLADAERALADLRPRAAGIDDLESEVRALEALDTATRALAALPAAEEPAGPDPTVATEARRLADAEATAAAKLAGAAQAAEHELARAEEAAARSAELHDDEDCPVCGQALGTALEQVRSHRAREVKAARRRLSDARSRLDEAEAAARTSAAAAEEAATALAAARQAWSAWEQHAARRADAEAAVDRAAGVLAALRPPGAAVVGDLDAARCELAARRKAATEVATLEGRLERADRVAIELAEVQSRLDEATTTRDALREKVHSLGFTPADLAAARSARQEARAQLDEVVELAGRARAGAAAAAAEKASAEARLADAKVQHADIADLAESARHLGRLGDLLADFRNNVVATVGPRLATQAAELFAELTDHEYDRLEVDADTYEIQITDTGRTFGMDRFSGSETDLANLALRVAISEQVRFQSGGAVGLLVLDEVFGPLDDERKERMLLALERLRGRFRQILVVTHDSSIKEQLPSAIQVEKRPGRRARATVVSGV